MTTQEVSDLQVAVGRPSARSWWRGDRVQVAALVVLALALRVPNLGRAYWIDEGITVGISSHPAARIPGLLREDGSPPLFYLLAHFWTRLFGSTEVATHLLPLTISLLAIPLGYWSGTVLFDRRAGIAAAALLATNPFLSWYSTETRMYTLVVVLSLVGVTFAWRAVRDHAWRDGAAAVAAFAALLYTHNWGIYLTVVTASVLLCLALSRPDRRLGFAVVVATFAVFVLWLPWLPSFLAQASNTAAPWAVGPDIGSFFADPSSALAGTLGAVLVPVMAIAVVLTRRGRSAVDAHVAGLMGGVGVLSILTGFLGAQLEPSWTVRYLAIIVAPLLLALAGALAHSMSGRLILAGICVSLAGWSVVGSLLPNPSARFAKSNVAAVSGQMASLLRPGDVVVVTQTEQVAVLAHYLPQGLVYVTPTGPVSDPTVVDWRDLVGRLQGATACEAVAPAIDSLPVDARVLEIDPARALGATGSAWSRAVRSQIAAVDGMLADAPDLEPIGFASPGKGPLPFSPVNAILFRKTGTAPVCS